MREDVGSRVDVLEKVEKFSQKRKEKFIKNLGFLEIEYLFNANNFLLKQIQREDLEICFLGVRMFIQSNLLLMVVT